MTTEKELLKGIDEKLQKLVRMRAEEKVQQYETKKEKILVLHNLELDTQEIAEIIGTSPGSVRATRSSLREEGEIDD